MDQLNEVGSVIALTMGVAWASGINLYAAILVLGLMGVTNNIVLPEQLEILMNPIVLIAAGGMYLVEFVADKTPGVDTGWDSIHTFIRIPMGALLAAGAVGEVDPAVSLAAGILGGGLAAATHATKAGSRMLINTSPEPVSNWIASLTEDVAVIGGLWTALHYPIAFIVFMVLFLILMIWLLPKIWKGIKHVFGAIGRLLGISKPEESIAAVAEAAVPKATQAAVSTPTPPAVKNQIAEKQVTETAGATEEQPQAAPDTSEALDTPEPDAANKAEEVNEKPEDPDAERPNLP